MAYFGLIEMETTAIEPRTKSATALNYINELDVALHLKNLKTKTIRRRNAEKKRFRAKKSSQQSRPIQIYKSTNGFLARFHVIYFFFRVVHLFVLAWAVFFLLNTRH